MNLPFPLKRKERAPASATADALSPTTGTPAHKKPRKKRVRIIAILLLIVIAAGVAAHLFLGKKTDDTSTYTETEVTRRDITTTLTGTGTLEPINQYNVTTLAKGEVLTCSFNEGDTVEKGELLYTIDSTDVAESIEKSRLSLQQSQLSYQQELDNLADLSVKAKKSGVITDVSVEVGDEVKSGDTIATLRDSAVMKLKVPFNSTDAKSFSVGEGATVTIDGSFESLSGRITEIDGADTVLDGYQMVRYVTLAVTNPGALSPSASGTATVNGIACNSGATFAYNAESTITADAAGTVASVPVSSGSTVSAGSVICKMTSTSLESQVQNSAISLKNAELSLQNTIDSLDDYKVTAPISGTVVTKTTQVGDSIDSSSGVSALAVIYDMSSLTFDIALDELDVNQVKVGQEVQVEVDALDGESFTGKITNISVAGTTTNGATTYPVTVEIDNPPAELLPGMNVNASIITGESTDVLAVPVAAIQRDNIIYVKDSGTDAGTVTTSQNTAADKQDASSDTSQQSGNTSRQAGGNFTEGSNRSTSGSESSSHSWKTSSSESSADSQNSAGSKTASENQASTSKVPEGFHAVTVKTGLSDDDYIEVTSGLSEGDIIYVPQAQRETSESTSQQQEGGFAMGGGGDMGGGDMSGGPPSGGGPGGGGMP